MSFEIGQVLETQQAFTLDIASVITGRTFMASITRWGKSWTARKAVEECFGHAGIIIIDPEGEYASLRERYPFLIIGKDIPIQIETAEFMADKVLETKISVIIDLSLVEEELGKEYVNTFLRRFFFLETTARQPYLVVIEEAEDFGPEKGVGTTTCLGIIVNLTKKGGKRGIGVLLIAHRPAWVSKGLISQCANKALGRIDWPGDLEVLEKYARVPHENIEKLPTLGKGEFCFTGDWVEETTFVKVGQVKTTHLGYTPEVIPPSPKELQGVIESLQRSLPEVIEKIKPTVVSTAELESKIKAEVEGKYKNRIEAILKTADEKAEHKYKVRIDQLQEQLERLSRSQALQPTAPVTDVLEHPIVKARMLQLDDKARDLLTWIEREPGHTREELAARMVSSKDVIASLVDKINRTFQLQVIVDDGGRPLRYRSMLKRLYITDVAKREIEELGKLQKHAKALEDEVNTLRPIAQQSTTLRSEVDRLRNQYTELFKVSEKGKSDINELLNQITKLTKENEAYSKIKEGLQTLGVTAPSIDIEKRLDTFRKEVVPEVLAEVKKIGLGPISEGATPIDEKKLEELIDQKIKELTAVGVPTDIPSEITVTTQQPTLLIKKQTPPLELTQESLDGRIAIVYAEGMLPEKAFTTGQLNQILETRFGTKEFPGNLAPACIKFVSWGYFEKVQAGKRWDYRVRMPAEEARSKDLIRE